MKPIVHTVRQIAELVGGTVEGDDSVIIESIASLESAGAGEITFATDLKRAAELAQSGAAAAIVGDFQVPETAAMPLIRVENVQTTVAKLLGEFAGDEDLPPAGVHDSAIIAADAELGESVSIGPGVVIGTRAKIAERVIICSNACIGAEIEIGPDTIIFEGAVIRHGCRIGSRVRIGPNSVIGTDGFGYHFADGIHHRIPHAGDVVIEDDVEIGACSCVDRAKFGSTRIGAGTKIDNLVQIAHNVQIGRGCILAGQSGIAGSTKLGSYVILGGGAGVRDNMSLGNGVRVSACAVVFSDLADGEAVVTLPATSPRKQVRIAMAGKKLPELLKAVKDLEKRLKALESSKDN